MMKVLVLTLAVVSLTACAHNCNKCHKMEHGEHYKK